MTQEPTVPNCGSRVHASFGLPPGRIEQIDWSPDDSRLLLVAAGTGADLAGIHGGYAQKQKSDAPAWLPELQWGEGDDLWRCVWIWDLTSEPVALTAAPLNAQRTAATRSSRSPATTTAREAGTAQTCP
ncbi:MAG: hypothetical protein R3D70_19910 [Rhizobiaceae bacterium]